MSFVWLFVVQFAWEHGIRDETVRWAIFFLAEKQFQAKVAVDDDTVRFSRKKDALIEEQTLDSQSVQQ